MADLVVCPLKIRHIPFGCVHEIFDAEILAGVIFDERGYLPVHEVGNFALPGPIGNCTHAFSCIFSMRFSQICSFFLQTCRSFAMTFMA